MTEYFEAADGPLPYEPHNPAAYESVPPEITVDSDDAESDTAPYEVDTSLVAAAEDAHQVYEPAARPEPYQKPAGEFEPLADTDERKVAFKEKYGALAHMVRRRAVNIDAHPEDASYRRQAAQLIPGFRAVSVRGTVVVEAGENKLLKVDPDYTPENIQEYATSRRRAEGMIGVEQLVACSDEADNPGVVVDDVPGITVDKLSSDQKEVIPATHYDAIIDTFEAMHARGLVPDLDVADNVIYNPDTDHGFTVVDYETVEPMIADEQDIPPEDVPIPTVATHAVKFGAYMLVHDLQLGDAVPAHALRFYDVCKSRLGEQADQIVDEWRNKGFLYDQ